MFLTQWESLAFIVADGMEDTGQGCGGRMAVEIPPKKSAALLNPAIRLFTVHGFERAAYKATTKYTGIRWNAWTVQV